MVTFHRNHRPGWWLLVLMLMAWGCHSQNPAFDENLSTPGSSDANAVANGGSGPDPTTGSEDQTAESKITVPSSSSSGDDASSTTEFYFHASDIETGALRLHGGSPYVDQLVTMAHNEVAASISYHQGTSSPQVQTYDQGSNQQSGSDQFIQNSHGTGILDILVVIDNSGSMQEEQVNLSTKLQPLLTYVSESNWQIGVITTDSANDCLRALIKKGDSDVEQSFTNAINAGTSGSGNEKGILQSVVGLEATCTGSWLRDNSTVAVLIVSDEDNCSDGTKCGDNPWGQGTYLTDYLAQIRNPGVDARVYGILWHPSHDSAQCETGFRQGPIYADVISSTQGKWGSICDADYSPTLEAMSLDISVILKNQFELSQLAKPTTVKVYWDGNLKTSGYTISGKTIEFTEVPPAGTTIRVDYDYFVQAPATVFALQKTPVESSLAVKGDGQTLSNYSYDANSNSIVFDQAPLVTEITIHYQEALQLQKDFALTDTINQSSLQVLVADQAVDSSTYTYHHEKGKITFTTPPPEGSKVTLSYKKIDSPQLGYTIFTANTTLEDLEVFEEVSGKGIPFLLGVGTIVFPEEEFEAGRKIVIRSEKLTKTEGSVDLGISIDPSAIKILGSTLCEADLIQVSGTIVDYSACGFTSEETLEVQFSYVSLHNTEFKLDGVDLNPDADADIAVYINDEATKDFIMNGNTLVVNHLPPNATVRVEVSHSAK